MSSRQISRDSTRYKNPSRIEFQRGREDYFSIYARLAVSILVFFICATTLSHIAGIHHCILECIKIINSFSDKLGSFNRSKVE